MAAQFLRELADIFDEGLAAQELIHPESIIASCKYYLKAH